MRIFLDDADRSAFLAIARKCSEIHEWNCVALALLSTHYHVVLDSTRPNLSTGFHRINGSYARYFNKRHGRFGHVFAERFSARLIEDEQYLYDACAYVVANPVAAGLCERAEDWPWSFSRFGLGDR